MILLDADGIIVASPNKAQRFMNIETICKDNLRTFFNDSHGVTSLTFTIFPEAPERNYIFFDTSASLGWKLAFVIPSRDIEKEVRIMKKVGIVLVSLHYCDRRPGATDRRTGQ